MKVLIFDTETTGLPMMAKARAETLENNWPNIVDIAWIVLDSDTNKILQQKSYIIKPQGWVIPEDATAIHGIHQSFAESYGSPLKDVLKEFFETECDMYVAHNSYFDENVLMNAVHWVLDGKLYEFKKPIRCTMNIARRMCKLPFTNGNSGYKSPKLSELYEHVFREKPIQSKLHGAAYDTKILTKIIQNYEPIRRELGLSARPIETPNVSTSQSIKGSILYL